MTFDPSSREAEAQAEIAATRLAGGAGPILVLGFLALLASWPVLELAAAARGASAVFAAFVAPTAPAGRLAVARRSIAEIETRFDERSALVRAVRPRAQLLLTSLAGYGNEEVLLGRDGWLFHRQDVEHLISRAPAARFAGDPATAIPEFRDQLAAWGIRLLVVPVPVKPSIHPERLTGRFVTRPVRRRDEAALFALLASRGVDLLDLAPHFARRAAIGEAYFRTDTHWRPETMDLAAREIALWARGTVELPPGDPGHWRDEPEAAERFGDSLAMLDLPSAAALFPPERFELRPVAESAAPAGAPHRAQVLLLGDSFAGIFDRNRWGERASLPHRLSYHLGLPVGFLGQAGGGATAIRKLLADQVRRDPETFRGVRLVVWAFATRELSQGDWQDVALPTPP